MEGKGGLVCKWCKWCEGLRSEASEKGPTRSKVGGAAVEDTLIRRTTLAAKALGTYGTTTLS